ncbi:NACHT domain-containing protein [Dactylosporangium sp. McL0621]|uniref:NACHT domain-containing protein n=1 Tax=Dactylosporangium sp. McL0621 TaxID=3415678 RepID=UPI003CF17960
MALRRKMTYAEAVALLGGDSPAVAAFDRALGGLLLVATAGGSELALGLFDAKGEGIRLGHEIVGSLRDRLRGYSRLDRTERLHAAHAVIVVTAFLEAVDDLDLDVEVGFTGMLLRAEALLPAPHRSAEDVTSELRRWYGAPAEDLARTVPGLAVWDRLDDRQRRELLQTLEGVPDRAVARYEILYRRLAADIPEFAFWSNQQEHRATRAQLGEARRSLAELERSLRAVSEGRAPDQRRAALARAYRAALDRPILTEGHPEPGLSIPTLDAGYLDPDFRLRSAEHEGTPAAEGWWEPAEVRRDLSVALAGLLTEPAATELPLLVLGQPGAGKSVLTRVLAARLPAPDFLPVRVELRDVPADAELQDQIEHAVRAATGEALSWPDLVRSAGDALPVVLLDGFDELLQATGVSQSDYLTRIVKFQQREADQGRPVAVLVTSRVAVADRARIPHGCRVVRLEPFRAEQVEQWLAIWNAANAAHLAALGLDPLPPAIALQQPDLAGQPLLLLLLAIYDMDGNALQHGVRVLDQAGLYDRLLRTFAEREVRKDRDHASAAELARHVDAELLRLAVTAFATYNRGRQWTTTAELDADLAALLPEPPRAAAAGFRAALGRADTVVGRFFFIQRAQAVRDGSRAETYEFLHATFGEYLVARLVHQVLADLARQEAASVGSLLGAARCQDGLLHALLSFAPLTNRGAVITFLSQIAARAPEEERAALRRLAVVLFHRLDERDDHRFAAYAPAHFPAPGRYARYGLNLVLLAAVYGGRVPAAELFGADHPVDAWRRHVLLWQSTLAAEEWYGVVFGTRVHREWRGDERDLVLELDGAGEARPAGPLDLHWTFSRAPSDEQRGRRGWGIGGWAVLTREAALLCDEHADLVTHALEPVLHRIGDTVVNVVGRPDHAESVAHSLLQTWLGYELIEVFTAYQSIFRAIEWGWPPFDQGALTNLATVAASRLAEDAARLPPAAVADWLEILCREPVVLPDSSSARLIDAALAALVHDDAGDRLRGILTRMARTPMLRLRVWVGLRELGLSDEAPPDVYLDQPAPEDRRLVARARLFLQADS